MGADKIEGVFSGDCIPLRRLHRDSVGDLCFAVIVFLQVFETVQPISGGIRLYGLGSYRPSQRVGKLHGYLGGPDLVRVVPVLPGNASLDRNFFRIKRSGGIEILDQRGAHLLGRLDHVIINIEVIPQISAYIGILVFLDVDPFGMKGADDLIRRTDMVAVGMSSDIKFKVFCGDPYGPHIGNNPVFISLTDDNPRPKRIPGITSVRIVVILTGVHHTELSVAFQQDGFCIARKRQIVDPGRRLSRFRSAAGRSRKHLTGKTQGHEDQKTQAFFRTSFIEGFLS